MSRRGRIVGLAISCHGVSHLFSTCMLLSKTMAKLAELLILRVQVTLHLAFLE